MSVNPKEFMLGGEISFLVLMLLQSITPLALAESPPLPIVAPEAPSSNFTKTLGPTRTDAIFRHFKEPYDRRARNQLTLQLLDVSPSSIRVSWSLINQTHTNSLLEASVICETFYGHMVSGKLHPELNTFEFRYLNSKTEYVICVYMLEKSAATNEKILHFTCAPFHTIPVLRPDSVLGVALTLGYVVLMGGLGYVAWWRRSQAIKRKLASDADDTARRNSQSEGGDSYEDLTARYTGNVNVTSELLGAKARPGSSGISRKESSYSEPALNGSSSYKSKGSSLSNLCSRPQKEQHSILYNAKDREISF